MAAPFGGAALIVVEALAKGSGLRDTPGVTRGWESVICLGFQRSDRERVSPRLSDWVQGPSVVEGVAKVASAHEPVVLVRPVV